MIPSIPWLYVDEFLLTKQAELTRSEYRSAILRFQSFVGIPTSEVRLNHAYLYRDRYKTELASSTINKHLFAAKEYFRFLALMGVIPTNPLEFLRLRTPHDSILTKGLSDDEARLILEASEGNALDSAVLHCLLYLGLRLNELISLRICDLSAENGISTVKILGKGNKRRELPIPGVLFDKLQTLLARASIRDADAPVFSLDGVRPISKSSIQRIVTKYARICGIKTKVSVHSMRVTAVSNALERGSNPVYVQAMGGWSSMDMVMRYDRRRKEIKNSAVFNINYGKGK